MMVKVMVIRYRGTSPKLGTSQGWCPYPCTQVSFFGDDGDEVVGLSSVFQHKGSPSKKQEQVSGILKSAARRILLNLDSYSQF